MREESQNDVQANVWDEPKDVAIVEMTDSGEKDGDEVVAVTHEASVGRVEVVGSIATNASSANENTSCNVDIMWKQVSPRREGLVGDGGEYRGGIRADPVECSVTNTSVTGKKREDLSELEQRFRGITSQLMARVHTETTEVETLAKAAEPASVQLEPQHDSEPSESLKNMSEAASVPPGDVKPWHLQMPDLGEMDQEKIKFEIDTLDEEEKQLMREIMKLEGKFS
ncbi:hypothetical protein HDU99_010516 [Rhizoclosmatium hyalinum]|nr:hypothetical protein HDU99_010516 [Rhizoclosmatium hyalinum]